MSIPVQNRRFGDVLQPYTIASERGKQGCVARRKETKATYYDFVRKNKHEIQAGLGVYLDKKNATGTFYK